MNNYQGFVPGRGEISFPSYEECRDWVKKEIVNSTLLVPTSSILYSGLVIAVVTDDANGITVYPLNKKYCK